MPSHVALLRASTSAVAKVAMADLGKVVESLGHGEVATDIQSGNVVFTSNRTDTALIAGEFGRALEETLGAQQRRGAVASRAGQGDCRQPVSRRGQPKHLHAIFPGAEVGAQEAAAVATAGRRPGTRAAATR